MGKIEEKLKEEICKEIYSKIIDIYDFIETRFTLSDEAREVIIKEFNSSNENITKILKEESLS